MTEDAAALFRISRDELRRFLSYDEQNDEAAAKPISQDTNYFLYVCILLFAVAFFLFAVVLIIYILTLRPRKDGKDGNPRKEEHPIKIETTDLVYRETSLSDLLPTYNELPRYYSYEIPNKNTKETSDENLRELRVEKIDVTGDFYTNRNLLQIKVSRVNLININESSKDDIFTYLVVSLEPDNQFYFETELRPVAGENYFEEVSEFEIGVDDIPSLTLKISVYATNRFSQHRLVNEYIYTMRCSTESLTITESAFLQQVILTEISRRDDNKVPKETTTSGEILFSLCYMPTSGRLTFVVLKGRHFCDQPDTPITTYVRVSHVVSGKKMKTVETSKESRFSNPVYNEAFVFHAPLEMMQDTDVVISVLSLDEKESSQPTQLGKVVVGASSANNLGRKHWETMLSTVRKPVAQWHFIDE